MIVPSAFTKSVRHRVLYAAMHFLDSTVTEGPFGHYDQKRVRKAVGRRQTIWESRIADRMADYFRDEHAAMRSVRSVKAADSRLAELAPHLHDALVESLLDVAKAHSSWVRQHVKTKARAKDEPDPLDADARNFLTRLSSKRVKDITKTTRQKLRALLAEGLDAGEGAPAIAKRIDTLYLDEIIPNRSLVIARTEVASAANYASLAAARDADVRMVKTWNANIDGREREAHREADGQTVGLDETFTVGGEALDFPGDPSGSPENIIQCRCFPTYTVK